jgi:hypothetical protein
VILLWLLYIYMGIPPMWEGYIRLVFVYFCKAG